MKYDLCHAKPGDLIKITCSSPAEKLFIGDIALFIGIETYLIPAEGSYYNGGYGYHKFLKNGIIHMFVLFLNENGITDSRDYFEKIS